MGCARHRSTRRLVSLVIATTLMGMTAIGSLAGCSTGRVWGRGAAAGAVGLGLTGLAASVATEPESSTDQTAIVIGSAVGGAVVGALIGHYFFDKKETPPQPASLAPPR
jgi:hypothetical protein